MIGQVINDFHWLRPYWLLALLPLAMLIAALLIQKGRASRWHKLIPPHLLAPMLVGNVQAKRRSPLLALTAAWLLATLALAGPSWERLPQPVHQSQEAMVILLDLSPSMLAEDIKPSRIVRARYKLIDLLKARTDGLTALVAYAGDAHVVTPLTDDTETIVSLLSALDPTTMPAAGSQVEAAVDRGLTLMHDSGITKGRLLLITDGVADDAASTMTDQLAETPFSLSILAIGTPDGAPIPLSRGFAKNNQGEVVISKLDVNALQSLASQNRGRFSTLTAGNDDVDFLLKSDIQLPPETIKTDRLFDTWDDKGTYLVLLLLPIALAAFRRGVLLSVTALTVMLPLYAPDTHAVDNPEIKPTTEHSAPSFWDSLWFTPDQQGQQLMQDDQPARAAETFTNPDWKASAAYKAGDYSTAASLFNGDTATDYYNRGNALAKGNRLQDALENYEKALEIDPAFEDASYNKKLVEDALQKQQEQEQEQEQQQEQNQQNQNNNQQREGQDSDQQQGGNNSQPNDQQQNNGDSGQAQQNQGNNQNGSDGQDRSEQGSQQNQDQTDGQNLSQEAAEQAAKESSSQGEQSDSDKDEQSEGRPKMAADDDEQNSDTDNQQALSAQASDSEDNSEQAQALEQWLRQVPDDPSGLLRRKFEYEYQQQRRQRQWQAPPGDQRW